MCIKKGLGTEIGLNESDKAGLIVQLKRFELYADDLKAYSLMPDDYTLDQKIMMWIVKEIYISPYRVYLNSLDRNTFLLKYLKTKKYVSEKPFYKLEEVISYCISCLHKEFEREKKK